MSNRFCCNIKNILFLILTFFFVGCSFHYDKGIQLEKDLAILIQSNIAKYIWGNDSYFEIDSKNDDFIKKSLDVLEKK